MSKLAGRMAELQQKGERALVAYVTGGDPSLEDLPEILATLSRAGVDAIEIGIPFSDPIADGPTIQGSSQRALDRGVKPADVLRQVGSFTAAHPDAPPLVLMVYTNTVMRWGWQAFAEAAKSAGVSGVIVTDLTPEESEAWRTAAKAAGLDTIFLLAPTSTDPRLDAIAPLSTGFVYAVSRTGVTGTENAVPADVAGLVERIKARTQTPVCVGFGISKPEHVRMVVSAADGAVVGSWLVDLLHREWSGGAGAGVVEAQVRGLKEATRR
ncbi:MAG: tryptophan synthase subunit alpha [Armatimonadetes bacterium]|nr:tryptophan synthase subunit alpha [Armatimonadota bacterium]